MSDRTARRKEKRRLLAPATRQFAIGAALATSAIALGFGWYLFHRSPVSGDELSQRRRTLPIANGHLIAKGEPRSEFFSTAETLQHGGRWSSQFHARRGRYSEAPILRADAKRNVPPHSLIFIDDGWHARLAARLRLFGLHPLMAERVVSSADACALQGALDEAERTAPNDPKRAADIIASMMDRDPSAAPVPGLTSATQLAFVPGRALSTECQRELGGASVGVSMDELLPFEPISATGSLDGPIVYARHFGPRNELLRSTFGDRSWFVAHRREHDGKVEFRFVPYQPASPEPEASPPDAARRRTDASGLLSPPR